MKSTLTRLACVLLVAFAGCGPDRQEQAGKQEPVAAKRTRVVLGISPFQDTLLPIIGEKQGWYAEEGLDVEIKILGWTEVQEALASGAIDVGVNNISSVISTQEQAPDLVYAYGFNTFDDGFALMIRADGPLKPLSAFLDRFPTRQAAVAATAQQLNGKTVITTGSTDMEQGVAAAARRGGLDFSRDLKIIDLNPDEGLAAFLSGEGDAYIGGIPQRTRAEKEGMIAMLTGADLGPPPINGFVTTRQFLGQNREAMLKLLKVWFRIVNYVNADIEKGGAIIVEQLNRQSGATFTIDDFKRFWNRIEHYPATPAEIEEQILSDTGRNYWKARWDDCNEYFFRIAKRIKKPVEPEGVFMMRELHKDYVQRYGDGRAPGSR